MTTYSVAEAKNTLPKLIDRALQGGEVVLTRHGKPVAELKPARQQPTAPAATYSWLRSRRRGTPGCWSNLCRDPGSALLARRSLNAYLDASVLLATLIEEAASAAVVAYALGSREFLVGDFAAAEVASGLARLIRMGLLEASDALARLADFDVRRAARSSPADIHSSDIRLAAAYVQRFDLALRAPDALHLAVAGRLDVPLVTPEPRLAAAAQELGVAVEEP